MNVIKVNYNNAAVKKPYPIVPSFYCARYIHETDGPCLDIYIESNLKSEPFFEDFMFEIYINDNLVRYINKNAEQNEEGQYVIHLYGDDIDLNDGNYNVQIKGTYYSIIKTERHFVTSTQSITPNHLTGEDLCCGDEIICDDIFYGYLHENKFYETMTEDPEHPGIFIFSNECEDTSIGVYVDILNNVAYKWNSNSNEYQLLY